MTYLALVQHMLAYPWNTLWVGVLCVATAFCVGLREILLSPDAPNYPKAGFSVRMMMFIWAAFLLLRGADLLIGLAHGQPQKIEASALWVSLPMFACQAAMLYGTLNSRMRASFWRLVERIVDFKRCGRQGRAIAELRVRGVQAIEPMGRLPAD